MYLNRKGQSILENVVTVTLVALGIILSWDLSSQLIGGGIKNLVSFLEEQNPHKYIQQGGGTGIGIPGCDCTSWVPPLSQPGTCNNPNCPYLEAAHTRICLPSGCENTVFPPIETLRCLNDNPACCGNPQNAAPPAGCGANALCVPNNSIPNCHLDGYCNDGTLLRWRECQFLNNWIYECDPNNGGVCDFTCGNSQPQPANTVPCPGYNIRLTGNTIPWTVVGQTQSSCTASPKCQVHCQTGTTYNSQTGECESQVCGNGNVEGQEICDHGTGGEFTPLALTCSGSGGSGEREQKMFCPPPPYGNCDRVGYRYYMRDFGNAHSPNYALYYSFNTSRYNNNQRVQFSCPSNKRLRLWDWHQTEGDVVNIRPSSNAPFCSGSSSQETKKCEAGAMVALNVRPNFPNGSWPHSGDGYTSAVIACPYSGGLAHNNIGFICEPPGRYDCFAMPYIRTGNHSLATVHGSPNTAYCPSGYYLALGGYPNNQGAYSVFDGNTGFAVCCNSNASLRINHHWGSSANQRRCYERNLTNVTFPLGQGDCNPNTTPICRWLNNQCEPVANGLYDREVISITRMNNAVKKLCCADNYVRYPQQTVHFMSVPDLKIVTVPANNYSSGVARMPSCPPSGYPQYTQVTFRFCEGDCSSDDLYIAVCNRP